MKQLLLESISVRFMHINDTASLMIPVTITTTSVQANVPIGVQYSCWKNMEVYLESRRTASQERSVCVVNGRHYSPLSYRAPLPPLSASSECEWSITSCEDGHLFLFFPSSFLSFPLQSFHIVYSLLLTRKANFQPSERTRYLSDLIIMYQDVLFCVCVCVRVCLQVWVTNR